MYLYSFTKYAGFDRVFVADPPTNTMQAGDIIARGHDTFLCLGEEISFAELYSYPYRSAGVPEVISPQLLSTQTMQLLHWMTYTRYASYKAVVKYFLDTDTEKLLSRQTTSKQKFSQELYIFPDLWTIYNTVPKTAQDHKDYVILCSSMTEKQKNTARRRIKHGAIHKIFCTHAEIFQDRHDLSKIYLHEPHKWYYANQQEPRYKVPLVVEKMKSIYGIT